MDAIIKRYDELYANMVRSKDPEKMKIFGSAETWAFRKMAEVNPRYAQMWVERLEPSCWDNYLSKDEAEEAVAILPLPGGMSGPKWTASQFEAAVAAAGGTIEFKPHYNRWALWCMANVMYSIHGKDLQALIAESELPKLIYSMSVNELQREKPKPMRIREMLGL